MFLKGKDEKTNQVVINIPCSCGCHSIAISYFDDECDVVYLSFFVDNFYNQDGIIKTIWGRIKKAFLILCGKSYRYETMILSQDDLKKLKQEFDNILQKNKEEKQ